MNHLIENRVQIVPFTLIDPLQHTMEDALYRYIDIKIHDQIKEGDFKKIIIIGKYDRSSVIFRFEKNDKIANWQRPTASRNGNVLYIEVFPGYDYVKHYAALISTYYRINKITSPEIRYILPSEEECWEPILKSDLVQLEPTNYAVIGYALPEISKTNTWKEYDTFHAQTEEISNKKVTFISFKHSFWGDIAGRLVTHLANIGFTKVIFIGKLGGLKPEYIPNQHIATGNFSFVEGEAIYWDNIFDKVSDTDVKHGKHISSPSVLYETKEWLSLVRDNFNFVDPEIGQFAKAAVRNSISFGYLHIISNTLTENYEENLSNERSPNVLVKRDALIHKLRSILYKTLD